VTNNLQNPATKWKRCKGFCDTYARGMHPRYSLRFDAYCQMTELVLLGSDNRQQKPVFFARRQRRSLFEECKMECFQTLFWTKKWKASLIYLVRNSSVNRVVLLFKWKPYLRNSKKNASITSWELVESITQCFAEL